MNFISINFISFFTIMLFILFTLKKKEHQHIFLLLSSYVFYIFCDYRFLLILLFISISMYILGFLIERTHQKIYLIIGIILNLVILGIFKYLNFMVESFSIALHLSLNVSKIMLPVGISFYIFQSLSYIIDIYHHKITSQSLINTLLYIGFFPQILSGPIVKAHDFIPQLDKNLIYNTENLSYGIQRFLLGIFKKTVIADRLSICVNAVYNSPSAYNSLSIWIAVISYSLELYYDFSGYSDMAIGIAKMIGFEYKENFNIPYLAQNPSDFWARWHISLSSWFKEYVYIPLGGNRKGNLRTYINLFFTMLLSGLWHGAGWNFIVWGILHSIYSITHKFLLSKFKVKHTPITTIFFIIFNYIIVSLFWVPFKVTKYSACKEIITRLFVPHSGINYIYIYSLIFMIITIIIIIYSSIFNNKQNIWKPLNLKIFSSKIIFVCLILMIFALGYFSDTAFIYSSF